jgi:hypothetical protein
MLMDGNGRNSNHLPHDFGVKTTNGDNGSRGKYLFVMIILAIGIVKYYWRYLITVNILKASPQVSYKKRAIRDIMNCPYHE